MFLEKLNYSHEKYFPLFISCVQTEKLHVQLIASSSRNLLSVKKKS